MKKLFIAISACFVLFSCEKEEYVGATNCVTTNEYTTWSENAYYKLTLLSSNKTYYNIYHSYDFSDAMTITKCGNKSDTLHDITSYDFETNNRIALEVYEKFKNNSKYEVDTIKAYDSVGNTIGLLSDYYNY